VSDNVVFLIASIMAAVALVACTAFIIRYWRTSRWNRSLVGRTIMHRAMTMWAILAYVFMSRWFEPPEPVQSAIGLAIWGGVALVEIRMLLVIAYITTGRVTLDQPNYTPIRNQWAKWRRRAIERGRDHSDS
jgi:RsiW-degrading membrane proteinase PrsW (M82 family)